jgi:hypothetical protein
MEYDRYMQAENVLGDDDFNRYVNDVLLRKDFRSDYEEAQIQAYISNL